MSHHNDNLPVSDLPPAVLAMEQLGRLASVRILGERLVTAAAQITAGWQKAGADAEAMRERITTILSDLDDGVVAAEQFASEAETVQQRIAAWAQVEALQALQEALTIVAERLK